MVSKPEVVALYRRVHSWVGILVSLFLFIGFYAGTLTQFEEPLQNWAASSKGLPAPVPLSRLGELRDKALSENPKARAGFTLYLSPEGAHPSSMSWVLQQDRDRGPGLTVYAGLDAQGHVVLAQRVPPQGARFLNMLHQRIGLPLNRAWGRPVMGIVAFLYAMALVSGVVVMLPSVVRAMFNMRLGQGARRAWFDLHTVLGVFSLPFHIMIAVTALGFALVEPLGMAERMLFVPVAKSVSSAEKHVLSEHDVRAKPETGLLEPAVLVDDMKREAPSFTPKEFDYFKKDGGFRVKAVGPDATTVTRTAQGGVALLDPYDGRLISVKDVPYRQSAQFLAATAIGGFHFGRFGGWAGHVGMALMSAVGSFLFYSGNALWLASRRRRERAAGYHEDRVGTRLLSALSTGVMFGCMAGVSAVLIAMLLVPHAEYYAVCERVFYAVFFGCLLLASSMGGIRAAPWLMRLVAGITLLLPLVDSWRHWQQGGVETFAVCLDLLALGLSVWLITASCGRGVARLMQAPTT
ncbi:PepSY-associated TM helix domain-containing protein [Neokomagataea thailandica]|uniref:Iron-regulated membrane protein n=1 Tax=Neokomagataea tanensis NBRC 106556 TaxID=1223519 RepID=A0ABQ0QGJ3_9PROT|nr:MULTISPECIES: PepSY-associated TM helix domain-containing protein [Neokomagataea]GBR43904.1 putative iron-regulated membrane protein [Neokomagataea tanensis NBRC 106556]